MDRLTVCPTQDGSLTFFSEQFGEALHSTYGAKTEAELKFVLPTGIAHKAQQQGQVSILDVCFGLGYNTASALDALANATPAVQVWGLENNWEVLRQAVAQQMHRIWSDRTQRVLEQLTQHPTVQDRDWKIQLILADARQGIHHVPDRAVDAIFFDPFSPKRCPQLWTIDFLRLVTAKLKPDGYWVTYSCASAVRSALLELGLKLWAVEPLGRKSCGTIASFAHTAVPQRSRHLTNLEYAILQTRAGIPYRDPQLRDSAAVIVARRKQEQQQSDRQSSSSWLKANLELECNQ
jgi:tRNA U34 5-methylaminomethyl-2-thiouridine-forming methyltransferase MnmC